VVEKLWVLPLGFAGSCDLPPIAYRLNLVPGGGVEDRTKRAKRKKLKETQGNAQLPLFRK
jgi:hypothetical protein